MPVVRPLQIKKTEPAEYYRVKYNIKENILLLKHIKSNYPFDWTILRNTTVLKFITQSYFLYQTKLIQPIIYHDYIWWAYPNSKRNEKLFQTFSNELQRDNGTPKCIIKIIQLINQITYFNQHIRRFFAF